MFQLQSSSASFGCNLYHGLCGCLGPEKFSSLPVYESESGAAMEEFHFGEKWIFEAGEQGHFPLRQLSAIISFKYKSHFVAARDDFSQLKSLTLL